MFAFLVQVVSAGAGGAGGWPAWLPSWESAIRSVLTLGGIGAILVTLFKPWTRERVFSLLKSNKNDYEGFVMAVVNSPERDGDFAAHLFRVGQAPEHAAMFKGLVASHFVDESKERQQMRKDLNEMGTFMKQAIEHIGDMEEFMDRVTATQQASAVTNALLVQSIDGMKDVVRSVCEEVKALRADNSATKQYLQDVSMNQRRHDREGIRARGAINDERGDCRRESDKTAQIAKKIIEDGD